jgi:glycosyltransferase involved in cell wall biosynthesis
MIRKITILVPCYNEEKTIVELLKRVINVDFEFDSEIIVVDD